jgi:hypothetical protein
MSESVDEHRAMGKAANNRTWELLGQEHRTPDEDRELVHAAHASLWHWLHGGDAVNEQRGVWLVSHVYAVLGVPAPALEYARRCWDLTERESLEGFDYGYACEAMARASAIAGDDAESRVWRTRAVDAATRIDDDEDRAIFEADLAAPPWTPRAEHG